MSLVLCRLICSLARVDELDLDSEGGSQLWFGVMETDSLRGSACLNSSRETIGDGVSDTAGNGASIGDWDRKSPDESEM